MKMLALACLFLGETLVIYAEEFGAKTYTLSGHLGGTFLETLVPLTIGAVCLVIGYMLGLKLFQNIWIVTAVSFGSILVVEPLFDFFYIGQVPATGAAIGVVLGALGILSAIFL
jgi:hypothetical protein